MRRLFRKIVPLSIRKKVVNIFRKSKINIYKQSVKKVDCDKKVSVVIPNYNYAKYIGERIDSIMMQSYPIYELIICIRKSSE